MIFWNRWYFPCSLELQFVSLLTNCVLSQSSGRCSNVFLKMRSWTVKTMLCDSVDEFALPKELLQKCTKIMYFVADLQAEKLSACKSATKYTILTRNCDTLFCPHKTTTFGTQLIFFQNMRRQTHVRCLITSIPWASWFPFLERSVRPGNGELPGLKQQNGNETPDFQKFLQRFPHYWASFRASMKRNGPSPTCLSAPLMTFLMDKILKVALW